ncbi:hypothetical protein [Rhizobium rhizogenes]|uniref:hypothetical protein n=1 Tax=Rhizobium rhizogenes TaxID=359 RepID=UPI0022B72725|nr:hypothetical protein [Rhizobium rhizogenes]MCZ7448230.1 hypothetical protein [Rhizobium rhizogenes]MCZ7465891.1 hypothetical protein [Rhizobium rhizogenes]
MRKSATYFLLQRRQKQSISTTGDSAANIMSYSTLRRYQHQSPMRPPKLDVLVSTIDHWLEKGHQGAAQGGSSTYIADALAHLRLTGRKVHDAMMTHTSPVG